MCFPVYFCTMPNTLNYTYNKLKVNYYYYFNDKKLFFLSGIYCLISQIFNFFRLYISGS